MKACPVCAQRYEDDILFCPADGAGLIRADDDVAVGPATLAETIASAPHSPAEHRAPAAASEPAEQPVATAEPVEPASERPHRTPRAETTDPLVGTRIFGDYVITKKLGEGGMGAVYRAVNEEIDQTIAIKVLHGHAAQNEELVKRFNREAKVICKLTHPNIIRVFIFGRTPNDTVFLAMEHVEGVTLRDIIEEEGHLDALRAIAIMRQCLHALEEAHELGIVHRDLKPDNIMLTRFRNVEEFVKVLDFGIAKIKDRPGDQNQKLTQAGVVYGTPEYLSPEQAQAKELDGRSDLYSMGVILYEMMTGYVPFHSSTAVAVLAAHVYDQPKPPSQVAKHAIDPRVDAIVARALAKKPHQRYATAMEFLADLEELEAELTSGAATKTTVLDASQLSLVLEVSRAAQIRREQMVLEAASGVRVPGASGPPPLPPGAASDILGPLPVDGGNAAQAPVARPAQNNQVLILWTVIAGLIVLLIMVFAALLYVNKQRRTAELEQPPAMEALAEALVNAAPGDLPPALVQPRASSSST